MDEITTVGRVWMLEFFNDVEAGNAQVLKWNFELFNHIGSLYKPKFGSSDQNAGYNYFMRITTANQ
ncbi:hypothetical protein [Paenibacillus peoriae]|uniref:hypothetical protein n=1 Tax=Paenibacillus peoriae TaxID=59893 RepID=UPI000A4C8427|nr:hypothetical protein [Paenibacillus peoriae]